MAKTAGEETSRTKLFELLIKNPGEVVSSSRVDGNCSPRRVRPFSRLHVRCATRGCRSNRCRRRATASAIWRRCRALPPTAVEYFMRGQSAFQKIPLFQRGRLYAERNKKPRAAGGSGRDSGLRRNPERGARAARTQLGGNAWEKSYLFRASAPEAQAGRSAAA